MKVKDNYILKYFVLTVIVFFLSLSISSVFKMQVKYVSEIAPNDKAQLFVDTGKGFSENQSSTKSIYNSTATLHFKIPYLFSLASIRLDPTNQKNALEINEISISNRLVPYSLINVDAEYLKNNIKPINTMVGQNANELHLIPESDDPYFVFSQNFIDKVNNIVLIWKILVFVAFEILGLLGMVACKKYNLSFLKIKSVIKQTFPVIAVYLRKSYINRYYIAFGILILAVLTELHGSSIGLYADILGYPSTDTKVWGVNRPIRSDEWLVFTPFVLSQYFNSFGYFSEIIRATPTDVFLLYGTPVLDSSVIFRPFLSGYLILSAAKGLSFFWYARFLTLLLISIDFGYLLTKKKVLAIGYAFLIACSPAIQWWFSINSFVEIIVFGEAAVLVTYKFIFSSNKLWRIFYIFLFFWIVSCYALALYPAWQVPFAYIFGSIWLYCVYVNRKQLKFSISEFFLIGVAIIIISLLLFHIYSFSHQTILSVQSTEYPGSRFVTGGGGNFLSLFSYILGIFLPFIDFSIQTNNSEISSFISFFPMGLLLSLWVIKKNKDLLLKILLAIDILLLVWFFIQWPGWLAKVTLLSNSPINRTLVAIDFLNLIILLRAVSLFDFKNIIHKNTLIYLLSFLSGVIVYASYIVYPTVYQNYEFGFIIAGLVVFIPCYMIIMNRQSMAIFTMICIAVVSGLTVNPIARGLASVYNNPIAKTISSISTQGNDKWLVVNQDISLNNYPIMQGAPTINSVNVYPDLTRWEIISNKAADKKIYNRYAHIKVLLQTDEDSKFELLQTDLFQLNLNVNDLSKLKVGYILTPYKLEELATASVSFEKVLDNGKMRIYKVKYN